MESCNSVQAFEVYIQKGRTETHMKKLNTLLSNSKTVVKGLDLLKYVFKYCSIEDLNDNVTSWLDMLLVKYADEFMELKLPIIKKIIKASLNNQELSKKISSEYLSKIIVLCINSKNSYTEIDLAFDVLITCMKTYNCTNHKTSIEAHILSFLGYSIEFIVEKAAIAFLYLQQTGNAGTKNINYITNFRTVVKKMCYSVHKLFDTFLQNKEIDQDNIVSQETFDFDIHPCDSGNTLNNIATSIKNAIVFIRVMLEKGFEVYKEITPMEILAVIKRGCVIHHCVSDHSVEYSLSDYEFCLLNTGIQVDLLHLLRVLIWWLGSSCLPYSFTISKILIDSLQRSQKCLCFNFNCVFHETVYGVITCYINISKCSLNSHFQTELIKCILNDIKPIKNEITLKKQSVNTREYAVKQKSTSINEDGIEKDELRCQLALDTLIALFNCSYLRVEPNLINSVLSLVMDVFREIVPSRIPHPYKSSKSQLKLHELLIACYEQETINNAPFISMTLNMLQQSSSVELKNLGIKCRQGINVLEKLCQPISSPFPLFQVQVEHTDDIGMNSDRDYNYKKTVNNSPKKSINIISDQIINNKAFVSNDPSRKVASVSSMLDKAITDSPKTSINIINDQIDNINIVASNDPNADIASTSPELDKFSDVDHRPEQSGVNKSYSSINLEDNTNNLEVDKGFEHISKKLKTTEENNTPETITSIPSDDITDRPIVSSSDDLELSSFTDEVQDY